MPNTSMLVVTTPAKTQDMTTLATVKGELGIADNKTDKQLARWIRAASSAISTYTRRVFAQETVTETFWQGGTTLGLPIGISLAPPLVTLPLRYDLANQLRLARYPVTDIISVSEDGAVLEPDGPDYLVDAEHGLLYRLNDQGNPIKWQARHMVVSYTAGYALLDDLPFDLEQAAILLVKNYYFTASRDPTLRQVSIPGVQEEQYWVGSFKNDENSALPPGVTGLLEPYREVRVT